MTANLKHSPDGLMEAFEHHLVYEVNMLRQTYALLTLPVWDGVLKNALIESFCIHARNLLEFFNQPSETPGQAKSDYVGAKHFCSGYQAWTKGRPNDAIVGLLSRQVSHLTYDRTKEAEGKIGGKEQMELFTAIERELEIFGAHLKKRYADKWLFAQTDATGPRLIIPNGPDTATNEIVIVGPDGLGKGYTGSVGPTLVIKR